MPQIRSVPATMRMMLVCERVCLCSAPKGPHLFGTGKILERRARTQTGEIVQIHPQPNARLNTQHRKWQQWSAQPFTYDCTLRTTLPIRLAMLHAP